MSISQLGSLLRRRRRFFFTTNWTANEGIMEGDEIEMSKEELRQWIRENVKNKPISSDVLKKCSVLQSLLEKREFQATQLLNLCESVAACEATVKKLYSLLGWEYKDTDFDDGPTSSSVCESVQSDSQAQLSPATNDLTQLQDRDDPISHNGIKITKSRQKKPVVALTRLPEHVIKAACSPKSPCSSNDKGSTTDLDSDVKWTPDNDSCNSDYCPSDNLNTGSNKRRKIDQQMSKATTQISTNSGAKTNTQKALYKSEVKAQSNAEKTSKAPQDPKGAPPVCIFSICQSNDKPTKTPPIVPQVELTVDMSVLARKKDMIWQPGKIVEIVTKGDGRVKYKVQFKKDGRSLVSGHHIALDSPPQLKHLDVGSRVVVKCPGDECHYCPGLVAELPVRKNRQRFLILKDDHTPAYVGLRNFHIVYKPLEDPLEDIRDENHRTFMKEYLASWPCPPLTMYIVGQTVKAEFNGAWQKCKVLEIDCNLIQVVFQEDQHKEWLYCGSIRLEHILNMKELQRLKKEKKNVFLSTSEK